jgi:hypothetical protein
MRTAHVLAREGDVAEVAAGFSARRSLVHALAEVTLDALLEVERDLLVELLRKRVLSPAIEEPLQHRHR